MNIQSVVQPQPAPPNEPSDGLLPAFSSKQYSHLPTPQSPNNFGRYVHDAPYSPESPMPHGGPSSAAPNQRNVHRRSASDVTSSRYASPSQQYMTPESSPLISRHSANTATTPRYFVPSASGEFTTPKQNQTVRLEAAARITSSNASSRMVTPPPAQTSEPPNHSSALSSPFMSKLSIVDNLIKTHGRTEQLGPNNNIASPPSSNPHALPPPSISTPPVSPPHETANPNAVPIAGGEMERIRQTMLAERLAQSREAEKRRPEYLKRAKRTLAEADPSFEEEDNMPESDRAIGIMETPHKGRRLKLFQETSEESFEESLMAGGYGRYRTADWVRQPQPISLPAAAIAGSSNIVTILEQAEQPEQPPSEKEIKKRKRLAAFKSTGANPSNSKLRAVELEGKGRVILDLQPEEPAPPATPEPTPVKKRANNRRKKKNADVLPNKKAAVDLEALDEHVEKPNWPDTEFPWRLRTEERLESAKAEEEERLRWIERFLDRDSDDEDDGESNVRPEQWDTPSISKYGVVYEHGVAQAYPTTRDKLVPIIAYSKNTRTMSRRVAFPSDPADARAALLSKRSVRALSYRQRKREREAGNEEDEVVCICHGKDDGRELVQCDACQTWYHLECIGIKSVTELGREEDPWFCRRCVRSPSPSREPDNHRVGSEPTFAPTDNEPISRRVLDAPFFPTSVQASPNWTTQRAPRTPTRNGTLSDFTYSWSDSSRPGPSTPQHSASDAKIYSSPPDSYGHPYEESPFDPTSTPSRGIRFYAPFTTPKNNTWLPRGPLFQTPSKVGGRAAGIAGSYPPVLEDPIFPNNHAAHDRFSRSGYDESPIRRSKAQVQEPLRHLHSPPRSKIPDSAMHYLEESPVVRSMIPADRERPQTFFEGGQLYGEDPIS